MPGFNIPLSSACHEPGVFDEEPGYSGPGNLRESARKHRYLLEILSPLSGVGSDSAAGGILLYLKHCTRPSPEIDEITIHNGQDEIYRPGKNRWRPLEFTFYEVMVDSESDNLDESASRIFGWWARQVVELSRSRMVQQFAVDAQLDMLDGTGKPMWTYLVYRCWPTKIQPCDLDYSDSDIAEIAVTMRFDKADERQRV